MKLAIVLGTRPEIIRLSVLIRKLDELCDLKVIHTGQNFDPALSQLFFEELGLRLPDVHMGVHSGRFGEQVGEILAKSQDIFESEKPDRLLILGDTNSGLSAVVAKRLAIPVYHMEAGNRCYDDRVPEEVNRRIIDHSSDVLMPYTERSRQNLIREGIAGERIYVTGNPILEVIRAHEERIESSGVLARLGLEAGKYFLVTAHRAENVDVPERLQNLVDSLRRLADEHGLPVVVSTHPRTRLRMEAAGLGGTDSVRFEPPFGFLDFVHMERRAFCVLSDSGTVQEECALFGVPNVTLRDVTERPETIECGSNVLSGVEPGRVAACVRVAVGLRGGWVPPPEYMKANVSETVVRIVSGYLGR